MTLREWHPGEPIAPLRELINNTYATLKAQGLNFVGTWQGDEETARRIQGARVFVLEDAGRLWGTISLDPHADSSDPRERFYHDSGTWVIHQFGVRPELRGQGWGSKLLAHACAVAKEAGATEIGLDTAMPATDLVAYYRRQGFEHRHEVQWESANYRSTVMFRNLEPDKRVVRFATAADTEDVVAIVQAVYKEYGFTWEADGYNADLYDTESAYPRPSSYFWVGVEGGKVVACAGLSRHESTGGPLRIAPDPRPGKTRIAGTDCELHRVYVHPDHQGKGWGKQMLATVIHQAAADGCSAMEIWSDVSLVKAHKMYLKLGATELGERRLDDPDDSLEKGFGWTLFE